MDEAPARPRVSVTIVAYNSADVIAATLASIAADVETGFAEVVVVDNASPDASAAVARSACPRARVIRAPENRYFAAGANLAWSEVGADLWLLLNPDVTVPPGGLPALVAWMDEHPEVGAASPNLVDEAGGALAPARRQPSIARTLLEAGRLHRLLPPRRRADLLLGAYLPDGEHLDVDWVVGAALIVRRAAVLAAGLLDETVAFYGEDSEWCARIRRAGWRIALADVGPFRHRGGSSTARTWSEREILRRTWLGIYDAQLRRHRRGYVAALWALNLLAFALEAVHPRRAPAATAASRAILRAHLELSGWLLDPRHRRAAATRAPTARGRS